MTRVRSGLWTGLWTGLGLVVWAGGAVAQQPVYTVPYASSGAHNSGTIQTGGTFQKIRSAEAGRRSFEFTNVCSVSGNCTATTNSCYLFYGPTASATKANSIPIPPGWQEARTQGIVPSDELAATCDGTGDAYRLEVQ